MLKEQRKRNKANGKAPEEETLGGRVDQLRAAENKRASRVNVGDRVRVKGEHAGTVK
jgi:hypothetical protein